MIPEGPRTTPSCDALSQHEGDVCTLSVVRVEPGGRLVFLLVFRCPPCVNANPSRSTVLRPLRASAATASPAAAQAHGQPIRKRPDSVTCRQQSTSSILEDVSIAWRLTAFMYVTTHKHSKGTSWWYQSPDKGLTCAVGAAQLARLLTDLALQGRLPLARGGAVGFERLQDGCRVLPPGHLRLQGRRRSSRPMPTGHQVAGMAPQPSRAAAPRCPGSLGTVTELLVCCMVFDACTARNHGRPGCCRLTSIRFSTSAFSARARSVHHTMVARLRMSCLTSENLS